MTITIILASLVVSLLIGLLATRLLRNVCSGAVRVLLGILAGLACLFVFGVAAFVYTVSTMEPPKPFNASAYKGQMGEISVPCKGKVTLTLDPQQVKGNGIQDRLFEGQDGTIKVPAGEYNVLYYTIESDHRKGGNVILKGRCATSEVPGIRISVPAGKTQELAIGPPLTASIDVSERDRDKVSMNLKLVGGKGESCSFRSADGSTPRFQILSKTGEILMTGAFRYG